MMYPRPRRFYLLMLCIVCVGSHVRAATFVVTNTLSTGVGSFRQALVAANNLPGPDVIQFNIPGSGVRVITPFNDWPSITDTVLIDATTQPGYSNAPLVMIVGGFGPSTGLMISANNCAFRGLCIAGFQGSGIYMFGSSNVVTGCYVGTDASGISARGNQIGILVSGGTGNVIGGATEGEGNLISGNFDLGICLLYSTRDFVQGNAIGTDKSGTTSLPNGYDGVSVDHSSDCTIGGSVRGEGNLISGNAGAGVRVIESPARGNVIQGNTIGPNGTGASSLPNRAGGIVIANAPANTIGGSEPGSANLISGNLANGILVQGNLASGNVIEGNIIGLDVTLGKSMANYLNGIAVEDGIGSTIGGLDPGSGNLISGNRLYGISIGGSNNVVQGNFVGFDATLTKAVPNGLDALSGGGVLLSGFNATLGGEDLRARNFISGNRHAGVRLEGAVGCVVQANWIGLNPLVQIVANEGNGIFITGSRENTIGGSDPDTGNVCSGNGQAGISISGPSATDNVFIGNRVGTDPDGHSARPNRGPGIALSAGASGNLIGGTAIGEGNLLSGNQSAGIQLSDSATTLNVLIGNRVGTDATGLNPLPNGGAGVEFSGGARTNQIGGTAPGEANRIAFNVGDGVLVRENGSIGNTFSANSIFATPGLAINLRPASEAPHRITPNDVGDSDTGPNQLQNAPAITNVSYAFGLTVMSGLLRSQPEHDYQIELFRNDPYSGNAFGQGQTYLGAISVATDAAGFAAFQVSLPATWGDQWFAATATDLDTGDTSEFSSAVPVLSGLLRIIETRRSGANQLVTFSTETNRQYTVEWAGSLPVAAWQAVPGAQNITGTGALVTITDPVTGSTQRFYRISRLQ